MTETTSNEVHETNIRDFKRLALNAQNTVVGYVCDGDTPLWHHQSYLKAKDRRCECSSKVHSYNHSVSSVFDRVALNKMGDMAQWWTLLGSDMSCQQSSAVR